MTSWSNDSRRLVLAVNYAPRQSQCYVTLELPELRGRRSSLIDLLGSARRERDGDELAGKGPYLDLPAWGYHVFEPQPLSG